jgi:hypothetical protein
MQTQTEPNPLEYWWQLCGGAELLHAFSAAPESEAWSVVERSPVLLLPELVDAAEQVLGPSRATAGLRQMQQALRGTPYFAPYHRLLVQVLAGERRGAPRTNLQRALAVMSEVRAVATEADRATDDQICSALRTALDAMMDGGAAAAAAAAPVAAALAVGSGPVSAASSEPAMARLFLDESDLRGFVRCGDRRGAGAEPGDRVLRAQGGTCAGSVEWSGHDEWAMHRVVETRWLFPSSKAAKAYLEDSATLMIAGEQLPRVSAPAIGDGAYAWGVTQPGRTPPPGQSRQIVMFRAGRVVGKLHVTEGPRAPQVFQRLSQEMLLPYLDVAVRRARWELSQYWLAIARATEAVNRFVQEPPRRAGSLFAEYPILLLPELPTAMASLGQAHRAAAERLVGLHGALKSDWSAYRGVLRALVRTLLDEPHGDPRVNADAALELVIAHRRLDSDFAWAAVEAECRERARSTEHQGRRAA